MKYDNQTYNTASAGDITDTSHTTTNDFYSDYNDTTTVDSDTDTDNDMYTITDIDDDTTENNIAECKDSDSDTINDDDDDDNDDASHPVNKTRSKRAQPNTETS